MSSTLEVTPTQINITPGGEVVWHVTDVAGGKLYTPRENPIADDPWAILRAYAYDPTHYNILGRGGEGAIKEFGDYAIKHYLDPTCDFEDSDLHWANANPLEHGSLPDLRANVALAEGLKIVPQLDNFDYVTRGLEIYGAFIPDGLSEREGEVLWLMEKLQPVDDDDQKDEVIRAESRKRLRKLYFAALELMGVKDYEVELDDCSENIVLTSLSTAEVGELVKIDSFANDGWLNF